MAILVEVMLLSFLVDFRIWWLDTWGCQSILESAWCSIPSTLQSGNVITEVASKMTAFWSLAILCLPLPFFVWLFSIIVFLSKCLLLFNVCSCWISLSVGNKIIFSFCFSFSHCLQIPGMNVERKCLGWSKTF